MSFFVVFSLSRSGSTTLHRALNLHPRIRCAYEPQMGDHHQTSDSLRAALARLRERFSGIKHVWDPSGFPFIREHISRVEEMELNRDLWLRLNREVLCAPNQRVIFLRRRNTLRRVVSDLLGQQTSVWGPRHDGPIAEGEHDRYRTSLAAHELAPLDEDTIRWYLRNESPMMDRLRQFVAESRNPCLDLVFEEIFGEDGERQACLPRILAFLGLPPVLDHARTELEILFHPRHGKLNAEAVLRRVPNIAAIERLGSDAQGRLFD